MPRRVVERGLAVAGKRRHGLAIARARFFHLAMSSYGPAVDDCLAIAIARLQYLAVLSYGPTVDDKRSFCLAIASARLQHLAASPYGPAVDDKKSCCRQEVVRPHRRSS